MSDNLVPEEHWHEEYPMCPYCNFEDTDATPDIDLTSDEEETTWVCPECGKEYNVMLHIDYKYTSSPIEGG